MTGIHLTVSAILSCWAVVVYGGETCGEGPCKIPHIVHVTSIPPTAIMNGSRMLDTALSVLGMVRARRACLEAGVGIVSLMVLVEEGDLANPALEQIKHLGIDLDESVAVNEIPVRDAADLPVLDVFTYVDEARAILSEVTVTMPRDLLQAARDAFPGADAYIYSNPDIIPFHDFYSNLVMSYPLALKHGASVLRTDIFCEKQYQCPDELIDLLHEVAVLDREMGADTHLSPQPIITLEDFNLLQGTAYNMPQVHPGHDLLIVPGSLIDCCLALLPEVFIGVKGVGTAILNTIKYCDCNRAGKHHQYEVAHQHATFHVGYGKASKWHQYSDFGKKHLYRSDEIKNLLSSMNIAMFNGQSAKLKAAPKPAQRQDCQV